MDQKLLLIDRVLKDLYDDHVSCLLSISNDSLKSIDILNMSTVRNAIEDYCNQQNSALTKYCGNIQKEVIRILNVSKFKISRTIRNEILSLVLKRLDSKLYVSRFEIFLESIVKSLSRFGIYVELSDYRVDITKSKVKSGAENIIRKKFRKITNEIDVLIEMNKTPSIFKKYKDSSVMAKVGFWGSIASIVGLAVTFYPSTAISLENQTVNGNKNTVIGENKGSVNIDYGSKIISNTKAYVLRNQSTGVTLVLSEPDPNKVMDSSFHVCNALAGTEISLTGNIEKINNIPLFRQVRILSGDCTGKQGWVAAENISYE